MYSLVACFHSGVRVLLGAAVPQGQRYYLSETRALENSILPIEFVSDWHTKLIPKAPATAKKMTLFFGIFSRVW